MELFERLLLSLFHSRMKSRLDRALNLEIRPREAERLRERVAALRLLLRSPDESRYESRGYSS